MKQLLGLGLLALSLFGATAFAEKVSTNFACSVTGGPGETQIQILAASDFVIHYPNNVKTIYSCGPFINDGSVVVDQKTAVVELLSDSCEHFKNGYVTHLIYCK